MTGLLSTVLALGILAMEGPIRRAFGKVRKKPE
jgi:hypothetical protein